MRTPDRVLSRRQFIEQSVCSAGLVALAQGAIHSSLAADGSQAKPRPFGYDVDALARTDPALLKYEQVGRLEVRSREPRRLALGPEGRIYVATKTGFSILDREGGSLAEISLPGPGRCIGVASDGTIYAGLRDHLEVFNAKGAPLGAWETPGKKTWFSGLAVGEKEVFAADAGNRVVLRYDRSGKLLGRIGEKNKERNIPGLIVPSPYLDAALGHDGLLRINNPGRHRVEVYTLEGDLELAWGKPSGAIEGFCGCCNPIALALLADGQHVTCEKGLPRVKVYGADGTFECVVAGPESFLENASPGSVHDLSDGTMGGLDAAVDSHGRIYILDIVARDIRIMQRKV